MWSELRSFLGNACAFVVRPIPLIVAALIVYAIALQIHEAALTTIGIGLLIMSGLFAIGVGVEQLYQRFGQSKRVESTQQRNVRWTRNFVLFFVVIGLVALALYSSQYIFREPYKMVFGVFGGGALLGLAALLCGAVLGFVFGIPRASRQGSEMNVRNGNGAGGEGPPSTGKARPNTNLEEISDWLTKIIVGLGLTKLGRIPEYIQRFTYFIAHSPGCPQPGCEPLPETVAFSVVASFGASGFLLGYLLTRLFLQQAFTDAESVEKALEKVNAEAVSSAPTDVSPQGALPFPKDPVTEGDVARTQQVRALTTKGLSRAMVKAELQSLAQEYEALRPQMPPGRERTVAMERVAKQMLSYSRVVTDDLFAELKVSESPGMRLAAVLCLEMMPRPTELDWLVGRIKNEKPFIGYHAALALWSAARTLEVKHYPKLRDAIEQAQAALEGKKETDRYRALSEALSELNNAN